MALNVSDLIAIACAAARAGGFACATPMLGLAEARVKSRLVLTVLLTLLLLPSTAAATGPAGDWNNLLLLFIAEAVTGVLIGLLLRCVIGTAALAAQLVEQQLGLPGNPDTEDEHASTTLGRLYQLTATAVFFGLGGHCMVVAGLLDLAPNGALSITDALHELTDRTATLALASIALALRLAAPVVLALLTANLAVGMIARVMPQFAGPSVAAPVQMAVGLVLVLVSLAAITTGLFDQFGLIARGLIPRL